MDSKAILLSITLSALFIVRASAIEKLPDEFGAGIRNGDLPRSQTSVRVFRPFFIKLNLPYSLISGETASIQVVVFNYSKRPQSATVTLENQNDDFEFVGAANRIEDEKRLNEKSQSRVIKIPANDGASASFLISPKRIGHIDIRVIARGELADDRVVGKLLVKPGGQTQHFNKAMLIDLNERQPRFKRNVTIEVPANAVEGSQKVFVTAVGDLMGAGLSHVDDLLRLPYGCGEQNMINLVPNIVLLNYLSNTRRLKEAQWARAVRNIETGYQTQLNYERSDGSFSAFGQQDTNGSVWLTAYVLKTFQRAKSAINVDERVIRRAANFIARFARPDGSIEEVGMVHNKALQSHSLADDGSTRSIYLTAYALIALLQRPIASDSEAPSPVAIDEVVERGLGFLEQHIDEAIKRQNQYNLAVIAYALTLANRTQAADKAYEHLWALANEDRDFVWWSDKTMESTTSSKLREKESLDGEFESIGRPQTSTSTTALPPLKPLPANSKQSAHLYMPDSLSVEMTALALLTSLKRGELERSFPIVRWLISQQNSNGGFASTQDTVLAIEALAAFAEANAGSKIAPSIDLDVIYPRLGSRGFRKTDSDQMLVTQSNALVSQQLRLPDNITWVQLQADGKGAAVVQVAWQYNIFVSAEKPAFFLNPILDKSSTVNYTQLSICTFYKGTGEASNMAVVEVELPSGYVADVETLPGLRRTTAIKRVDTADGETKVIIYLERVTRDELCFTVAAHRSSKVSNYKPVPVTIYDYYDRKQVARIFYEPRATSSCEICGADTNCGSECEQQPKKSDRLVSLHEQRKIKRPQTHANLTASSGTSNEAVSGAHANNNALQLLPLAPVVMTIVTAARHFY